MFRQRAQGARDRAGDRRAASAASSNGILASVTQWSISTKRRALCGMPEANASSGSCTTVVPPRALIDCSPGVPSPSLPVRTTPITAGPQASAAEWNSGSMAGRELCSLGPRLRQRRPRCTSR